MNTDKTAEGFSCSYCFVKLFVFFKITFAVLPVMRAFIILVSYCNEYYMKEILEQYKDRLIQMRYNKNTISTYCNCFEDFCKYFKSTKLQNILPTIKKFVFH